jgi:hypothetical protein
VTLPCQFCKRLCIHTLAKGWQVGVRTVGNLLLQIKHARKAGAADLEVKMAAVEARRFLGILCLNFKGNIVASFGHIHRLVVELHAGDFAQHNTPLGGNAQGCANLPFTDMRRQGGSIRSLSCSRCGSKWGFYYGLGLKDVAVTLKLQ